MKGGSKGGRCRGHAYPPKEKADLVKVGCGEKLQDVGPFLGNNRGKESWWISLASWSRTFLRWEVTSTPCFLRV
jgi:hypothetical protein